MVVGSGHQSPVRKWVRIGLDLKLNNKLIINGSVAGDGSIDNPISGDMVARQEGDGGRRVAAAAHYGRVRFLIGVFF